MSDRPPRRRGELASIPGGGARGLAWEILRRVDETAAFADVLIGNRLASTELEDRDRALVTQLVYGTLAWRGFLDRAIDTFSRTPAAKLEPALRTLLEMALFQLFVLDRVPAYAAVDQAVELSKTHGGGRATKLVNAVLRRAAAAGRDAVVLPDREGRPAEHLAARYSHPPWLVERWLRELGEGETEALLRANNGPAPTVARVNRLRTSRDRELEAISGTGGEAEAGRWSDTAITLAGPMAEVAAAVAEGRLTVQSEASQLVSLLLGPGPGERILDACAGSGGKTTHLAELSDDRAAVLGVDRRSGLLRRLRSEALRLELRSISAVAADATRPPLAPGAAFDGILVDAPCSGLGTLRQHPEIRWRRRPADASASALVQRRLLDAALEHLRPGGALVYATCSLLAEENEDVVAAFLTAHAEVRREDAREVLPPRLHDLVDVDGALRTTPHRQGLDGFYAVRLKRL